MDQFVTAAEIGRELKIGYEPIGRVCTVEALTRQGLEALLVLARQGASPGQRLLPMPDGRVLESCGVVSPEAGLVVADGAGGRYKVLRALSWKIAPGSSVGDALSEIVEGVTKALALGAVQLARDDQAAAARILGAERQSQVALAA